MKNKNLLLLFYLALYSLLFYHQSQGINFLIFSIALIAAQRFMHADLMKNKGWVFCAICSIVTGVCVMLYGNTLSYITNILSLSFASGYALHKRNSLLFSGVYALYSYLSSMPFLLRGETLKKKENTGNSIFSKVLIVGGPILISLLFFGLYRQSNPMFYELTAKINLDFITMPWIAFNVLGFFILQGFFFPRYIPALYLWDVSSSDSLAPGNGIVGNGISSLINQNTSAILLFTLLNIMLFVVNCLDIQYVWIMNALPAGYSYSTFIHSGVNTIILSIVIAIGLILYYLRGDLNFYEKNKTIVLLASAWIVQNALLVMSSLLKNNMYVFDQGLTYKRIGVYIYLLLCLIGLVTTFIKVAKTKSNWFLFRWNSWLFYAVLVITCIFNWDAIIAKYNLSHEKKPDISYLLTLSPRVLPEIMENKKEVLNDREAKDLQEKVDFFKTQMNDESWPSWTYNNHTVILYLNNLKR